MDEFLHPSILDALQDGVVVYDEQERIVYCNPAAMSILGVEEDELATGRRAWGPLGTDGLPLPADRRPVAITGATGEPCRGVDVGLRRADGSVAWTSVSTKALRTTPDAAPPHDRHRPRDLPQDRRAPGRADLGRGARGRRQRLPLHPAGRAGLRYLPPMPDVAMPRLSDSMEEGTILKWLKSDGDEVKRGEELVEIETDKANMTYEADQDGVLKIVASEGDTLPVGETIASIGEGGGGGESAGSGSEEQEQEEPKGEEPDDDEQQDEDGTQDEKDEDEKQPEPEAEEEPSDDSAESEPQAEASREEPEPDAEPEQGDAGSGNGRIKASPVARRMAREMGLELAKLEGTGPGGRIVKADVEAAAGDGGKAQPAEQERGTATTEKEKPQPEKADAKAKQDGPGPVVSGEGQTGRGEPERHDLSRLQQTVARRMAESKATAPDFVLNVDVEMDEAVELRKQLKAAADGQPAPSFNDFVVKASALALAEYPRANGAYKDGKFELYSRVNVGVAVAAQDALVVPTVFDADRKSLGRIAAESRALAERVRGGSITPPELSSGTFTVSNLGMFGIDHFVAVINPPQAAILAVGAMKPTPVVVDGEVQVRTIMKLTLTCDHRILYGADAASFLARIRERLERPLTLAL